MQNDRQIAVRVQMAVWPTSIAALHWGTMKDPLHSAQDGTIKLCVGLLSKSQRGLFDSPAPTCVLQQSGSSAQGCWPQTEAGSGR